MTDEGKNGPSSPPIASSAMVVGAGGLVIVCLPPFEPRAPTSAGTTRASARTAAAARQIGDGR